MLPSKVKAALDHLILEPRDLPRSAATPDQPEHVLTAIPVEHIDQGQTPIFGAGQYDLSDLGEPLAEYVGV